MIHDIENWRTQIRKGYLELCMLALIKAHKRLYGFELLEMLKDTDLPVKEGTLYPLLNRMNADGMLATVWDIENVKGHPRKFYSITEDGKRALKEMQAEYEKMAEIYEKLKK